MTKFKGVFEDFRKLNKNMKIILKLVFICISMTQIGPELFKPCLAQNWMLDFY